MRKLTLFLLFIFFGFSLQASVICIPGFLVCYKDMETIGRVLMRNGEDVCLWNYPSREKTICQHAQDLCKKLTCISEEHPGEPIDFVVHSVGAVILRTAVNLPDCPQEAKMGRAVLIAPCNRGAKLARKFKKVAVIRWLMGSKTGSELMRYTPDEMMQFGDFSDSMQILVLAGKKGSHLLFSEPNDGMITVEETTVNTPYTRYILPLDHHELLINRYAVHLTKNFILYGEE